MDSIAGLSIFEFVVCCAIVGLAGVVRGYSGFGFSALVVMSLVLVLPPAEVVPIAFILEIGASFAMLPRLWRDVRWDIAGWLFAGAVIGNPLGVYLLATVDPDHMKIAISAFVLAACLMLFRGFRLRGAAGPVANGATGLLSGLVNGAGAVGGLPVVVLLMAGGVQAGAMRATLVGYLFLTDIYALALSGYGKLVDETLLLRAALFAIPLALGIFTGSRIFRRADPAHFRRVVLVLLLLLALGGTGQTLFL